MRKSELMIALVRAIIILALGGINPDVYSTDTEMYISRDGPDCPYM